MAGAEREQDTSIEFKEVHPLLEREKGHTCEGGPKETGILVTTLQEAMSLHPEGVLRIKILGGAWDFYWGQERRFFLRNFMTRRYQKMLVGEIFDGQENYRWLTQDERELIPYPLGERTPWYSKQNPNPAWFEFIKPLEAYRCRIMLPFLVNPVLIEESEVMLPVTDPRDLVGVTRRIHGKLVSWEIPVYIPREHFAIFCRGNKLILERHLLDARSEQARLENRQILSSKTLSEIPPPPPANF